MNSPQRKLLVTGGAGFIGANFVHHWRKRHPGATLLVLDALTYAGNRMSLAALEGGEGFEFTQGDIAGLQHWSDEGVASWYDFAVAIQEEALDRGLLGRAIPIRAIRTEDYPTPARRPRYSVLDKRHTVAALGYAPPHWRVSLRNMLDELAAT